tara:strand:+ start:1790 stop:2326 length:537 start_codon:yes stop_codon:yes gene_type:complete
MIHDIQNCSRILISACLNLLENQKIVELAQVLYTVNCETILQAKFNDLEICNDGRKVVPEGSMRASVDYFLHRSNEICNDYQFAANCCDSVISLSRCIEENIREKNYNFLYALTNEIFLENFLQRKENSLTEFRVAEYLISNEDREVCDIRLFKRVQRIAEQTYSKRDSDRFNDDLPF